MQPGGAAPARDSQSRPGGPGRPSGSHYGEPAIDGRHGRNERKVKACASPVYRKRSGDRKRRKSSADGASLSAPWSAAGRVRGCRSLTAPGRMPPMPRFRQSSAAADHVLTEASSGAPLPRFVLREKRMVRRNARRARVAKDGRMARASFSPRMSDLSDMRH